MFKSDPNKEWESLGKNNPYYGVLSDEKFRNSNLNKGRMDEFFRSGEVYIDRVLNNIRKHLDNAYEPRSAIDFGCGVGRLVIPLASRASHVTGIDVSKSMLAEAGSNCATRSLNNVHLIESDDRLSLLCGKYNFIHSFIVFQHIPVEMGLNLYQRLIEHLEPGGVAVTHFTYASRNRKKRLASFVRSWLPLGTNLINLLRGKPFFDEHMQMNEYDLNKIFMIVQDGKAANCFIDFEDHNGELGVVVYFQRAHD